MQPRRPLSARTSSALSTRAESARPMRPSSARPSAQFDMLYALGSTFKEAQRRVELSREPLAALTPRGGGSSTRGLRQPPLSSTTIFTPRVSRLLPQRPNPPAQQLPLHPPPLDDVREVVDELTRLERALRVDSLRGVDEALLSAVRDRAEKANAVATRVLQSGDFFKKNCFKKGNFDAQFLLDKLFLRGGGT
jgi:hypothetical protein